MPSASKIAAGVIAAGALATSGTLTANQAINPYTSVPVIQNGISTTGMAIAASSTIPDAGIVQTTAVATKPEVIFSKWSGQVNMDITYEGLPASTTGATPFMSRDVDWNGATSSMQAIPLTASTTMEDGGMEINIILNSKPATNTFAFAVSGTNDLDFFYQPPLWQDAGLNAPTALCTDTVCDIGGAGTSARPENIVGSYAVYYKDHSNHIEGQTNYATGKAYQIFRPLVTDSTGSTTWATLSYATGTLTVTVPQDFLDNATYPVTIDPTFGYTTHGASHAVTGIGSALVASIVGSYIASSGDNVTSFSVWGNYPTAAGSGLDVALFSVVGGVVTNQLATGINITIASTDSLNTSSAISQNPVAGTQYGVAFSGQNASTNGYDIDFDTGTAPGRFGSTLTSLPGAGGGFSPTGTDSGTHYSIYATYTAGATFAPWQFSDF